MDTKVLVPGHATNGHDESEIEHFHALGCAAVLHAAKGLDPLSTEEQAEYLSAHPRLFAGISYLPNLITPELIEEAKAHAENPRVVRFLKERF